jgi:hypothetical protein
MSAALSTETKDNNSAAPASFARIAPSPKLHPAADADTGLAPVIDAGCSMSALFPVVS